MPEIDDEHETMLSAVVPDLVFERVVEHDELALMPGACRRGRRLGRVVGVGVRDAQEHVSGHLETEMSSYATIGRSAVRPDVHARTQQREFHLAAFARARRFDLLDESARARHLLAVRVHSPTAHKQRKLFPFASLTQILVLRHERVLLLVQLIQRLRTNCFPVALQFLLVLFNFIKYSFYYRFFSEIDREYL